MANSRLVLLPIVVAFVATIIVPQVSYAFLNFDSGKIKKLAKTSLSADDALATLRSVKEPGQAKLGEMTVKSVLELAALAEESRDKPLSKKDCQYDAISELTEPWLNSNLILFKNVFQLLYPRLMNCDQNIDAIFHNSQKLKALNSKEFEKAEEVAKILGSFEDKHRAKIGNATVQTILEQASQTEFSDSDCQDLDLLRRSYIVDIIYYKYRLLLKNLRKFDEGRNRLLSFCADKAYASFKSIINQEIDPKDKKYILDVLYKELQREKFLRRKERFYAASYNCRSVFKAYQVGRYIWDNTGREKSVGKTFNKLIYDEEELRDLASACLTYEFRVQRHKYFTSWDQISYFDKIWM